MKKSNFSKDEFEINKDINDFLNCAKPYTPPKITKRIEKSCHNCMDYIVCWGFDEISEDKGKDCTDWHLDFATYQEIIESK